MLTAPRRRAVAGFKAAFGPGLSRVATSEVLGGRSLYNEIPASSGGGAGHGGAAAAKASGKPQAAGGPSATGGLLRGLALGGGGGAAGAAAGPAAVIRIGSETPADDLRALLRAAGGDSGAIAAAAAQVSGAVAALAADPFSVERALDLILELRRQASNNLSELVPRFNDFLRALRAAEGPGASPPHGSPLWQRLVCTSTSLISVVECPRAADQGAASGAEAAAFFDAAPPSSGAGGGAAAAELRMDDDDLGLD